VSGDTSAYRVVFYCDVGDQARAERPAVLQTHEHTPINAKTTIQVAAENAHVEAFRRLIAELPDRRRTPRTP
jgi:hypothetical protein